MATRRPLVNVSGALREIPTGDTVPIAALATGTPTGAKFVRDDGTLSEPIPSHVLAFAAAYG